MSGSQEGFAAVDAMVALAILGGVFAVGLSALISVRNVATTAAEMTAADSVLRLVADRQPGAVGYESGRFGRFRWTARTTRVDVIAQGPSTCRRTTTANSDRTGRRYEVSTYVFCRPPEPGS